jgi:hypothetical protein
MSAVSSRIVLPAAVLVLGHAARALAQGCAMCGSALGGDDALALGRAFSWSVLFLMASPYVIVGAAGAILYYLHRRVPGRPRGTVIDLTGRPRPARSGGEVQ